MNNMNVSDFGKLFIEQVKATNDQFELHEDDVTYHMVGRAPEKMLTFIYSQSPDLATAIEGFAMMCGIFNHFGASDKLCQEWFEYNVKRWSNNHKIDSKQFQKTIKEMELAE